MPPDGDGLVYQDQQAAEEALHRLRLAHLDVIGRLETLNRRLDSLSLSKLIEETREKLSRIY